jgi:CelD/BcsL family acetyltransferase involved in cellulose biosynthesis
MIRTQVQSKLVEGDHLMPWSIALDFEHSQSSPGQIDFLALLRI